MGQQFPNTCQLELQGFLREKENALMHHINSGFIFFLFKIYFYWSIADLPPWLPSRGTFQPWYGKVKLKYSQWFFELWY